MGFWGQQKWNRGKLILSGLVAAGIGFRLQLYLSNRSFWLDEAVFVIDILRRSYKDFWFGLKIDTTVSAAPAGFLSVEKWLVSLFGRSELVSRFFPLVASLLAIFLFVVWLKKQDKATIYVAAALFCFSPKLIYYAAELKPYASDVVFFLLIGIVFEHYYEKNFRFFSSSVVVLGSGMLSIIFCFPAVFVLAGVGCVKGVKFVFLKQWEKIASLFFCVCVWVYGFYVLHSYTTQQLRTAGNLNRMWQDVFLSAPYFSLANIHLVIGGAKAAFVDPLGFTFPFLAIFLFVVGGGFLYKQDRERLALLLMPIAVTLAAAALQKYPFSGRLILFLTPAAYFLIAKGAAVFLEHKKNAFKVMGIIMTAALLTPFLQANIGRVIHGYENEDMRSVARYLLANRQQEDRVFMNLSAVAAAGYYVMPSFKEQGFFTANIFLDDAELIPEDRSAIFKVKRYILSDEGILFGMQNLYANQGFKIQPEQIKQKFSGARVWVLFSHARPATQQMVLAVFDKTGQRLRSFEARGASAFLFQINREE